MTMIDSTRTVRQAAKPRAMSSVTSNGAGEEEAISLLMNEASGWQKTSTMTDTTSNNYYVKSYTPTPPPTYVCHRCGKPGHYINHCPTNGDPNYDFHKVKKPTGIPKSFLKPITQDEAKKQGTLMMPGGGFAVMTPNEDVFELEAKKFYSDNTEGGIPKSLQCPLCKELLVEAVIVTCCGKTFCSDCMSSEVPHERISCPMCHRTVTKNKLVANNTIRKEVQVFRETMEKKQDEDEKSSKKKRKSLKNTDRKKSRDSSKNETSRKESSRHESSRRDSSRHGSRSDRSDPRDERSRRYSDSRRGSDRRHESRGTGVIRLAGDTENTKVVDIKDREKTREESDKESRRHRSSKRDKDKSRSKRSSRREDKEVDRSSRSTRSSRSDKSKRKSETDSTYKERHKEERSPENRKRNRSPETNGEEKPTKKRKTEVKLEKASDTFNSEPKPIKTEKRSFPDVMSKSSVTEDRANIEHTLGNKRKAEVNPDELVKKEGTVNR
eukprot:TRINITY_DN9940_c0_g1_i1.p1 TRINITY_DN9940_c0_g1~~TRINITY_DN9940_c0_g1_i1.p1  ORF type:complete len:579 (-),score=140.92 TRINITY_DN9940_c0_g1_i1:69-1553(-)